MLTSLTRTGERAHCPQPPKRPGDHRGPEQDMVEGLGAGQGEGEPAQPPPVPPLDRGEHVADRGYPICRSGAPPRGEDDPADLSPESNSMELARAIPARPPQSSEDGD